MRKKACKANENIEVNKLIENIKARIVNMKILFFLEPSIEHGNPYFRYATLRNSLVPQAKNLKKKHEVILFTSEHIANKAISEGYDEFFDKIVGVNSIDWELKENSFPRLVRYQNEKIPGKEVKLIKNHLVNLLGEEYTPDIILVWESPTYYLNNIYPKAKVLYQTPGFFSRAPYPALTMFDKKLLSCDEPVRHNMADYTSELLEIESCRRKDISLLNDTFPLKSLVSESYQKFERIILYPLQVDNYFMINSLLPQGVTQFDVLLDLLKKLPSNIGLWVTNYRSKDIQSAVLSDQNINYLQKEFKNFLFFSECDDVPSVSQFLVPVLDGVVTISSSVGYQAAYYKKPLYLLGKPNHLSSFTSSDTLEDFYEDVVNKKSNDKDINIIDLIKNKHLSNHFLSSDEYVSWLEKYHESGEFPLWCNNVGSTLIQLRRESQLLKETGYFDKAQLNAKHNICPELLGQIRKHDVISFDIFDTLLYRPFKKPSDLFKYIESKVHNILENNVIDFRIQRTMAETRAFKKAIAEGKGEITLNNIYDELKSSLLFDEQTKNKLMQLELEAELSFLYPRMSGLLAFKEAIKSGKNVILISDMYLPQEFLEKVLSKNGYEGYQHLFVSSTYGVKKHNGKLFDIVLEKTVFPASSILHIGDNIIGDVKQAKSRGFNVFHLQKAIELFEKNSSYIRPWLRDERNHAMDWQMILTIIGQKLHDNPLKIYRRGTVFNGDRWQLGYMGLGVLLLGYVKWLIEKSTRDGIDTLYFLARDGKIMKAAYDVISQLYPNAPKSAYMLCSRRSINLAKVKNINDIRDLLYVDFAHRVSLGHLLENRFGLMKYHVEDRVLKDMGLTWGSKLTKEDLPRLDILVQTLSSEILKVASKEREAYLEYLQSINLSNASDNIAIVDIGYAGTMQESLYQLTGKNISGYYLITFRKALERLEKNGLASQAYLAEFIDRHDTYHPFCRHVPLYETLFSTTDTSFIKMVKTWNNKLQPIFMPSMESEDIRIGFVRKVHEGALEFINDVVTILGESLCDLDIEPNKTIRMLDQLFNDPHPRDARLFSGVVFEDAYGGTHQKIILPLDNDLDGGEGVWKNGIAVLRKDLSLVDRSSEKQNKETLNRKEKDSALKIGSDDLHQDRSLWQKTIYFCLIKTLPDRKKEKFLKNPKMFFFDSKSKVLKKIGNQYLK